MSDLFKTIVTRVEKPADNVDYSIFDDKIKIQQMNEKHAFVNSLGGKPCVLCYIYDETFDKEVIEFRTAEAISLQYSNVNIYVPTSGGNTSSVPLGRYWIQHKERREYETVVFNPAKPKEFAPNPKEPEKKVLNLWEGFAVTPTKGSWKKSRKHIYNILCNKNKVKFKYFIKWLAWSMQNPDKQAEVAIVIKGKQGAGKGFVFSQFKEIFGPHFMNISSGDHLTGKFNQHLRKCVFLFADEAYDPKDREAEGKLKQLITEKTIPVEAKFRDTVIATNRLHIVMATNNLRILSATEDTRRFFINETDNTWAKGQGKTDEQRNAYFTPLFKEMNNGGREAMLYDLLNIKLGEWHPRSSVPDTDEIFNQRRAQYNEINALLEYIEQGEIPGKKAPKGYIVKAKELEIHMRNTVPMMRDAMKLPWRRIAEAIDDLGINTKNLRKKRTKEGIVYIFPELNVMRRLWEFKHKSYRGQWDLHDRPRSRSEADIQQWRSEREWILTKDAF